MSPWSEVKTTIVLSHSPDSLGRGELYDIDADPAELDNRWNDPQLREIRARLTEHLLRWTIRTDDDLPQGVHVPKRLPHNWGFAARTDRPNPQLAASIGHHT